MDKQDKQEFNESWCDAIWFNLKPAVGITISLLLIFIFKFIITQQFSFAESTADGLIYGVLAAYIARSMGFLERK